MQVVLIYPVMVEFPLIVGGVSSIAVVFRLLSFFMY